MSLLHENHWDTACKNRVVESGSEGSSTLKTEAEFKLAQNFNIFGTVNELIEGI